MNAETIVTTEISSLLAQRWSPYGFDGERSLLAQDLEALFEAARSSASSYNAQPWRFVVGVKDLDPDVWQGIYDSLLPGNQSWAKHAPVLVLGVVKPDFDDGKANVAAEYDLGAAATSLSIEATRRGISVHQMIGLDRDAAEARFGLGEDKGLRVFTALAVGYAKNLPQDSELAPRDAQRRPRKPLNELILTGRLA